MAEFGKFKTGLSADAEARAKLIEELSQLARSGPRHTPIAPQAKQEANAKWEEVKALPIIMMVGLLGVSALFSQGGLGSNLSTCVTLFVVGVPLLIIIIKLNQKHRNAFIDKEIANGASRAEAEKKYRDVYSD